MADDVREILLDTIEASLEAQLSAVRRLRKKGTPRKKRASRSQLDIVYDLLKTADRPLHITQIVEEAHQRFGEKFDRESLVSALSKRVVRGDRFKRTAPNTFAALDSHGQKEVG